MLPVTNKINSEKSPKSRNKKNKKKKFDKNSVTNLETSRANQELNPALHLKSLVFYQLSYRDNLNENDSVTKLIKKTL